MIAVVYTEGVSESTPNQNQPTLSPQELVALVTTLQTELLGLKTRMDEGEVQNDSLRETIVNLTHENELLKRRLYGNKTERTNTSELQLTLGELLKDEKQLQKELDAAVAAAQNDGNEAPSKPKHKPKAAPTGIPGPFLSKSKLTARPVIPV